ncbi:MAG: molybdopterin molybdenumtransferase MoeA [Rhizobiales bacterium]|nr:molybdopterin molybdenumtransferase MoeA [Hyphomicrobiales bacterium]
MALMPVAEALAHVLDGAEPLPAQAVPLGEALGRVLAKDLVALRTQPPDAVSAMDGYAVRAEDVAHAPVTLTVIGEVAAGHPFNGAVGPEQAARIFTGGVLPPGADAIVIQENTTRERERVTVQAVVKPGRNVRRAGLDFSRGDVLLRRSHRLTARDLMLAAAMNYPAVPVHRRAKVGVLATGDELVPPGSQPGPGEIVYSNGFGLSALARSEGAEVLDLGIARDRIDATAAAIRRAREAQCDVLVTMGGASVGDHDVVQQALAAEGLALAFWKIALRPGKPMMHGRLGGMAVLGLPGNPVSSFVCAVLFLVPLLRRLAGRLDISAEMQDAVLGHGLPENDERADYLRSTLVEGPDGEPIATPLPLQDSSMMAPLARANCLLIREPHAPAAPAGSPCRILKLGT